MRCIVVVVVGNGILLLDVVTFRKVGCSGVQRRVQVIRIHLHAAPNGGWRTGHAAIEGAGEVARGCVDFRPRS